MKRLFFLAMVFIPGAAFAQNAQDSVAPADNVKAVSRFRNGTVELRWYPVSAAAWRKANQLGYSVKRMEMSDAGSRSGAKELAVIKPYTAEEWRQKTNTNDELVKATMESVIPSTPVKGQGFADAQDEENAMFFAYSLATSFSGEAAKGAGLVFIDNNIEAGKEYVYSISIINGKGKKDEKDETLVFVTDTRSAYESPAPQDLSVEEAEGVIKLSWNNTTNQDNFVGYDIERSGDGGRTFTKLNTTPFITVAEDADELLYNDSVKNYIPYQYRIVGITPWADRSNPSVVVNAMGRDKTPASPPMNTRAKGDRNKIIVTWELPAASRDLQGFKVARGNKIEGPFNSISGDKLITPGLKMFADEKPSPREPYYVVYSVDTAGNYNSTFSVMASVYDSIAPAKPVAVNGTIDSTGVVQLNWKMGNDNDLVGYNIYVANGKDNVFRQLTGYPLNDSLFRDTVSMRSLTPEVYYKITAIDYNNNASAYSELVVLKRPDVIPPAAPLISDYAVTGNKITLTMTGSSSDDIVDYKLNRTDANGSTTTLTTARELKTYTDETVVEGESYSYILIATDAAKHQTASKPLQVTVLEQEIKEGISKLTARANDKDKQVLLNWNGLTDSKVSTLVLFRGFNGEEMKMYKKLYPDKESYVDNADAGKYQYAIKVLYSNGAESELSEVASAEIKN